MINRKGISDLQVAASAGDAYAQFELGELHRQAPDGKRDYQEAVKWHWEAARQGNSDSRLILIEMLPNCFMKESIIRDVRRWGLQLAEQGNVRAQYAMAFASEEEPMNYFYTHHYLHWMHQAANQDYPKAIFLLGIYHEFVGGPERDESKSFELYRKAAEIGFAPAMECLGVLYAEGRGTRQDDDEAIKWLQRAISHGRSREASLAIGIIHERKATPESLRNAANYYRQAFEAHNELALFHPGQIHEHGRGGPVNYPEALKCYQQCIDFLCEYSRNNELAFIRLKNSTAVKYRLDFKNCRLAAESGDASAQTDYGLFLYDTIFLKPETNEKAERFFQLAADQGDAKGQFCHGCMIVKRTGMQNDMGAIQWFNKSATQGYSEGQAAMGRACLEQSNYKEAAKWFELASEQGDTGATIELGRLIYEGKGTEIDQATAIDMFRQVAEQGYKERICLYKSIDSKGPIRYKDDERLWCVRG